MKANRWLVEHVHHAGQSRTNLRRQSNALRLATRQRVSRPYQRKVVEANIVQEREPAGNFLQYPIRNGHFLRAQFHLVEPLKRVFQ